MMKRSTIICNIYNELCLFAIWWSDLQFFQHRKRFMCSPIYYQYLGNPNHKHVHENVLNISFVDLNLIFWALWNIGSNSIHWYYLWPLLVLCVSFYSRICNVFDSPGISNGILHIQLWHLWCILYMPHLVRDLDSQNLPWFLHCLSERGVKYIWSGIVLADRIK